ncbi:hypothetical protein CCM_07773 [Cordyceps militaris CM01]|uniref:LPXTG-domain-containing protein n=1 Tax=Cordyceps militaris (strain CM01) TaxID=983644 RepID=G3JQL7_CORMM|nr:uncharacterized protein CCM_07773 [Cordyceps militaris CM01]EGX89521.1 hypothetical protein CCM_07773 [Cordyceps militaris CM01]
MASQRAFRVGSALLLAWVFSTADALQVTPGSKCAKVCLDSGSDNPWKASDSNTNITDVTCSDASYLNTPVGQHYQRCLSCLQRSNRFWDGEADLKWFVYNLRYTLDACLFSIPSTPANDHDIPCSTNGACHALKSSLSNDKLEPNPSLAWDYCAADDGNFMSQNQSLCRDCLRNSNDQVYMANFITALEAGCRQTPNDGDVLGLSATIFSKSSVDIIDPQRVTNPDQPSGDLPAPAIAGIVVGVVLVCLIAVCLLVAHCRRERRQGSWTDDPYDSEPQHSPYRAPNAWTPSGGGLGRGLKSHVVRPYRGEQVYMGGNSRAHSEKTTPVSATQQHPVAVELRSGPPAATHDHDHDGVPTPHGYYRRRQPSQSTIVTPAPTYDGDDCDELRRGRAPSRTQAGRDDDYFSHRGGGGEDRKEPQPPPPISVGLPANPRRRSNTPDSFAEQAYMAAAEESERIAARHAARASQLYYPASSLAGAEAASSKRDSSGKLSSMLPNAMTWKIKVPSLFRSSSPNRPIMNISAPILETAPRYSIAPRGPVVVDPNRQRRVVPRMRQEAVSSDLYG